MKIAVDINHPGQVHFFKNFIKEMRRHGHDILLTVSEKDLTYKLLDIYRLDFLPMGSYGSTLRSKIYNLSIMNLKMYGAMKNYNPDILIGFGSVRASHVSRMLGKPCVIFDDDEYSYPFYYLFADSIVGFSGFKKSSKKIIKINSYKELAYLHPNYFHPDRKILSEAGISRCEEFVVLRFVGWQAFHDIGKYGFNLDAKLRLVQELEEYATVFITSESLLPNELVRYSLPLEPNNIHDLLFYSRLLMGDSQTMTTEAGILGTPAIRCNSFVGNNDMGNFIELEQKYGLIFNYDNPEKALSKSIELIQNSNLKNMWKSKRQRLLEDKIDSTAFLIWFIEHYPDSFYEVKKDAEIIDKYRGTSAIL